MQLEYSYESLVSPANKLVTRSSLTSISSTDCSSQSSGGWWLHVHHDICTLSVEAKLEGVSVALVVGAWSQCCFFVTCSWCVFTSPVLWLSCGTGATAVCPPVSQSVYLYTSIVIRYNISYDR